MEDLVESSSNKDSLVNLYAFDFDHTIIDENSDISIPKSLIGEIPERQKELFDGKNWTDFMDNVFKYMCEQGITISQIQEKLKALELAPGMGNLLETLLKNCPPSKFVIISDANTIFIETVMKERFGNNAEYSLITNPAKVIKEGENSRIFLKPYENQTLCPNCPSNLCKGSTIEKMIESSTYDTVFYAGDGKNDFCPGSKLRSKDVLFVRKGFALEKLLQIPEKLCQIKAKIIFYENGIEIQNFIKF